MKSCKHIWFEIESNEIGQPIKYKCKKCLKEYIVKGTETNISRGAKAVKEVLTIFSQFQPYFDKINSLLNRIEENEQKIAFIKLNPIGSNQTIHLKQLQKEIVIFKKLINQNI